MIETGPGGRCRRPRKDHVERDVHAHVLAGVATCVLVIATACGKSAPPPSSVVVSSDQIEQLAETKAVEPATTANAASTSGPEWILQNFEEKNGTEDFDAYVWDYGKAKPVLGQARDATAREARRRRETSSA